MFIIYAPLEIHHYIYHPYSRRDAGAVPAVEEAQGAIHEGAEGGSGGGRGILNTYFQHGRFVLQAAPNWV